MKKLLLGAAVALLPLTSMAATILGFQAGVGSWKHDPSGNFAASVADTTSRADLKNDLNLAEESEGYSYFVVEHPVPLIPNFKYVNTKLSSSGSGTIATDFTFNGINYTNGNAVTSSFTLDQTDAIFYYEILDNDLVSFDLGLNAKRIDGQASAVSGGSNESVTFSGTVPMLYAAAEIGLPAGFTLAGEISTLSIGDNEISDITAKVTYTTDFNLGVEAGLRTMSVKIEEDNVTADMDFSGIFAGVYFKF